LPPSAEPYAASGSASGEGLPVAPISCDVLDVHNALEKLTKLDPRQARVVEFRYFGGLDNAEVLGISQETVLRHWRVARAWLYYRLRQSASDQA
jgi:DNA-directed RNA polymerase specialized sigma24 family protein